MCKHIWFFLILSQVTLFLLLTDPTYQCGTGRGGWRRRGNRKMTPLVFRQYIPNVSENTLGASGMAEGKITRDSDRFKKLVVNYNPEIIFKDEEGTGADRYMTQRCKDKLNTLAISVENTWPGVRLRVTEGWDEDLKHAEDSLHYEGRAVDVTTSDKDRSKYGMLARLAVEAGFDYVFYESRGHIHCSVKSDNSITHDYGGCFSADDTIILADGSIKSMADLQLNDYVLSVTPEGHSVFSPVILFFHQNSAFPADYLQIYMDSQHSITITPNHLIYFSTKNNTKPKDLRAAFATLVSVGDYLYLTDLQGNIMAQKVVHISKRPQVGIYAPLTKQGTIVVNNVVTSCYAHINHHGIAHASLAPVRWIHTVSTWFGDRQHLRKNLTQPEHQNIQSNVHWYADILHSLALYVIPHDLLYNS